MKKIATGWFAPAVFPALWWHKWSTSSSAQRVLTRDSYIMYVRIVDLNRYAQLHDPGTIHIAGNTCVA